MKIIEIIHGNSSYTTLKNSKLSKNKIIMFNTLFSISDISNSSNYILKLKEELSPFGEYYEFKREIKELKENIPKTKYEFGLAIQT